MTPIATKAGEPATVTQSRTILIVEDSAIQAELLRRTLVAAGYSVLVASDGVQGLTMAEAHRPDAVVSDINMPLMDGYQMCDAIRKKDALKSIPVILVTMLSDPKDVIQGLKSGADGYLTKPYNAPSLISRIESLLTSPVTPYRGVDRRKMEVLLAGERYSVQVNSQRMLNLFVSTYENAVLQNRELAVTQQALEELNAQLERKVLERTAALRESEEKYHSLFAEARDGIVLIDGETGFITDCNAEFETQSGRKLEQLKALRIWELRPPEKMEAARKKFFEVKESGSGDSDSLELQQPNGTIIPIEFTAKVLRLNDRPCIQSITRDIAERKEAEKKRQHDEERLRLSLEATIHAVAATVEMRDAYTAGHQRRVADLAAAIAKELGLPDEQIHGLHLAGTVHDVGKIHIPAEILSKPGKLTDIEFRFIKTHPQAGYDILKDVEFPWPIAQMVLQHHERSDGRGYPQGLKDGQILLEARILAVADIVEAMTSDRPYRPGLGIETALEEIVKHRGTHFDPAAVDACVKLFREKGYTLG